MRRTLQNKNGSLLIKVPKEYVTDLGLKVGQQLDFRLKGKEIIAVPVPNKTVRS